MEASAATDAASGEDEARAHQLNAVGRELANRGDHAGAVDAYERALELRERHLGPTHPEVAVRIGWISSPSVHTTLESASSSHPPLKRIKAQAVHEFDRGFVQPRTQRRRKGHPALKLKSADLRCGAAWHPTPVCTSTLGFERGTTTSPSYGDSCAPAERCT